MIRHYHDLHCVPDMPSNQCESSNQVYSISNQHLIDPDHTLQELFSELMADGMDGNAIYLSSDSEGRDDAACLIYFCLGLIYDIDI